ncbi:MAG: VWA domain-containing protein [Deltaproteobacteria bacterium]|nr:VWA domain-containing protein [Deltaproteobacteria bacterium]
MDLRLLEPRALWLLGAALPLVALYVLRARRVRVRVPSTWLWEAARREALARRPWQRLRPEASLLLELLAVLALSLAAAKPVVRRPEARAHVALIIDESASMGTRESASTRLELARRAAEAFLRAVPSDTDVLVLGAAHEARVLSAPTRDPTALRAALQRARAWDVEGGLDEALRLADDRLRALGGSGRIVVVSDGAVARSGSARPRVPVELLRVGAPVINVALSRVELRAARDPRGHDVVQAFALVANLGEAATTISLTARLSPGGEALASHTLELPAGGRVPVTLTFPALAGREGLGVVLEKTPPDALTADDRVFAVIPPGRSLAVTVDAPEEEPWLLRALAADPEVVVRRGPSREAPEDGLLFVLGACPAAVPSRSVVVLGPPPGRCGEVSVGAAVEAPRITAYATTDPRLRFLTLDGVHLVRATPLELGPHATALVRSDLGVLAADASDALGTRTVLGFTPGESDWPLHASFVVFVRNTVELARAQRARRLAGSSRTAEPLRVEVPGSVTALTARTPEGSVTLPVVDGAALLGETRRAGLYALRWPGGESLRPVNFLSEREGDLRGATWVPPQGARSSSPRGAPPPRELPGPWLALLAALAALGDLLWLSRTKRLTRGAA